jgi:hypothetical protein
VFAIKAHSRNSHEERQQSNPELLSLALSTLLLKKLMHGKIFVVRGVG